MAYILSVSVLGAGDTLGILWKQELQQAIKELLVAMQRPGFITVRGKAGRKM